jgi:uncharacterized protein (TIGR00297 family)
MQQLMLGFLLGILIAALAWRARALNRSGAWAAAISGGVIFGLGGFPWVVLLMAFFISSSVLSRAFARLKASLSEKFSKGSQRDWGQVLANGGLSALLAIVHALYPDQAWPWVAFAGAMAAVNADTWATELGVLNPTPPRLVTTGKIVERGASGGVSLLGSLAALVGAVFIALFASIFSIWNTLPSSSFLILLAAATLGGLCGAFFDSLLGASLQAIYFCSTCQKETERHPLHLCGTPTVQVRGLSWLDNDVVNFSASLMGALSTILIWRLLIWL